MILNLSQIQFSNKCKHIHIFRSWCFDLLCILNKNVFPFLDAVLFPRRSLLSCFSFIALITCQTYAGFRPSSHSPGHIEIIGFFFFFNISYSRNARRCGEGMGVFKTSCLKEDAKAKNQSPVIGCLLIQPTLALCFCGL